MAHSRLVEGFKGAFVGTMGGGLLGATEFLGARVLSAPEGLQNPLVIIGVAAACGLVGGAVGLARGGSNLVAQEKTYPVREVPYPAYERSLQRQGRLVESTPPQN